MRTEDSGTKLAAVRLNGEKQVIGRGVKLQVARLNEEKQVVGRGVKLRVARLNIKKARIVGKTIYLTCKWCDTIK